MTHRKKLLASFCKYGNLQKITSLDGIPSTNYIYAVVNGDNVLQIGKSGPKNKGRLKLVFKGSILGKHNKAFICGLYPHISGNNNEYYAISLNEGADKSKVEQLIHGDMGITTNVQAATFIDDLTNKGIIEFHEFLWDKFREIDCYKQMDSTEKQMALELFELVTYGKTKITRSSGKVVTSSQADNLEGNILKCLGKKYLTTVWLKMCNQYFRYGNAHSISPEMFEVVKSTYHYIQRGLPFDVFGKSS